MQLGNIKVNCNRVVSKYCLLSQFKTYESVHIEVISGKRSMLVEWFVTVWHGKRKVSIIRRHQPAITLDIHLGRISRLLHYLDSVRLAKYCAHKCK